MSGYDPREAKLPKWAMTDELIKRLRVPDPVCQEQIIANLAADRIEALTAEYDEAMECNEQFFVDNEFLKKRVTALTAERDGLLRCVTDNHVALCRAEAAEAEAAEAEAAEAEAAALKAQNREMALDVLASSGQAADAYAAQLAAEAENDRLREALKELLEVSRRAVRLSVEHDNFKLYAMEPMERAILLSHAALKGESHE